MSNLTISMRLEEYAMDSTMRFLIFSEDAYLSKQLVDEILERTTLVEGSFTIRCMD